MPYLTNAFTDQDALDSGNDALTTQAIRLAERRKELRDQALLIAQQGQPQGQMISGHFVAPSTSQQLLPMIGQAVVESKRDSLNQEARELDRRTNEAAMRHFANVPGPNATPQEQAAWAQQARQIPGLEQIGNGVLTEQIVRAPERAEARADRRETKEMTFAEAQRKQREDQQFRAEQAEQNRATQMLIAQMSRNGRGGGGSGSASAVPSDGEQAWQTVRNPKGSDIISKDNNDGTTTLVYKPTGEKKIVGQIGKPSTTFERGQADDVKKVSNAKEALNLLKEMDPLIDSATHSGVGAAFDTGLKAFGGSTKAGDSAAALANKAANLATFADRGMFGPQFSDADVKALKEAVGNLGDPTIPISQKRATYNSVVSKFKRQAGMADSSQTVRGALEDAVQKHSAPAPKVRTYNPATGRLE